MEDSILLMLNDDGVAEVYDDTYDIVIHCTSEEDQIRAIKLLRRLLWTPVQEQLPENDDYVLLSFANFALPMVGRYEHDGDGGGAWYLGDCDGADTCIANDLFVNAWMELPKPYRPE